MYPLAIVLITQNSSVWSDITTGLRECPYRRWQRRVEPGQRNRKNPRHFRILFAAERLCGVVRIYAALYESYCSGKLLPRSSKLARDIQAMAAA